MPSSVGTPSRGGIRRNTGGGQPDDVGVPCIDVLRSTPLFAGLSEEQLRVIAPPCRQMPVCRGKILFAKGDPAKDIYILLKGQVCLEEELSVGERLTPRTILVERVSRNGVIGLCALIEPRRALLTARCEDEATVMAIDVDTLRALMKAHSNIGLVVLENAFKIAYERLACAHQRIVSDLGLPTMYETYRNY